MSSRNKVAVAAIVCVLAGALAACGGSESDTEAERAPASTRESGGGSGGIADAATHGIEEESRPTTETPAPEPEPEPERQPQPAPEPEPEPEPRYTEDSIPYMLAVIDTERPVDLDDPLLIRYDRALTRFTAKCNENRQAVADLAVRGSQLLEERGVQASTLDVLVAGDESIPDELGRTKCSDIIAAYIILSTEGG